MPLVEFLRRRIPARFRPVWHRGSYLLYARPLDGENPPAVALQPGEDLVIVETPEALRALAAEGRPVEGAAIPDDPERGIAAGAALICLFAGKRLVHSSWVATSGRAAIYDAIFQSGVEADNEGAGFIGPCATAADYRGRGAYPRALAIACRHLAGQGRTIALINCVATNAASRRGIEKAGFALLRPLPFTWILGKRHVG